MPSDYITINALAKELNNTLSSGKIDRITMPEKDEVNIFVRANNVNYNLAISCNASNPRIHLTSAKKLNPITAPSFCMHLRKHLSSGIIKNVYTLSEDRIIVIEILSHNEMRDEVLYKLVIEMMGRYSNLIVLNEKNVITDVLKQASFDMMTKRMLVPSAKYSVPEQTKLALSKENQIKDALNLYDGNSLSKYILSIVSGFAKSTIDNILFELNINDNVNQLSQENIDNIIAKFKEYESINETKNYCPCVELDDNNQAIDYYVKPYKSIKNVLKMNSLNEAIEYTLSKKDEKFRQEEKTKFLSKAYNSYLSKTLKRLEKSNNRFNESQNKDNYKILGELIIANIYKLQKGDTSLIAQNYYSDNMEDIEIKLDPTLTPQQNAQSYFKKYSKLKHQEEVSLEQIEELEETIEYVKSIEPFISRCKTPQEIAEVQTELENIGALKVQIKKNKRKEKESAPIIYKINGFEVLIGKNNLQNDKISFKIANGGDIWLHVKSFHGSHAIILTEGKEVPNDVLLTACEVCAFYSSTGDEQKVEVDYTFRKNVKRHPNKKPGMVLYEVYQTAVVTPCEHKELKKN